MPASVSVTERTRAGAFTRPFYGWVIVFVAAAAMVGTLPGRTQGLGLITEPLLADLRLDRVTYATLNFWATIAGSLAAVGMGPAIDRFGSRLVLTGVAAALAVVVCAMSLVSSTAQLGLTLTLTRALGQSALSVVSLAMVGQWFVRRIDPAMAVYSVTMSIGFMIAFPAVGALVQREGWRDAWLAVGSGLIALALISALLVRRTPESVGLASDGDVRSPKRAGISRGSAAIAGHSWQFAVRTPAFWLFALGTALYGLVASGIGLFNESILAERGFDAGVYYQTLVVTAMTALAGNFAGGWLARCASPTRLLACSLCVLAAGLLALPQVSRLWQVMAWAAAMGIGGGLVMVLFFSVWPRLFGRRHLGRIQGGAQALTVMASAVGPLALAWCLQWTGSYAMVFRILGTVILGVAGASLVVGLPAPPPSQETRPVM